MKKISKIIRIFFLVVIPMGIVLYSLFGGGGGIANVLAYYVVIVCPFGLTSLNVKNWFTKNVVHERIDSTLTLCIGAILYFLDLTILGGDQAGDWYEQIYAHQLHYSISSRYLPGIVCILLLGVIGFLILLYTNADKLPPLWSITSIAAVILFNIMHLVYAIQISEHSMSEFGYFLYLYHFNLLLITALSVRRHMMGQLEMYASQAKAQEEHARFRMFYRLMRTVSGYSLLVFMALFFLIAVLEILFVVMGLGVDAPVKAFTDTADWYFSTQIPPPPLEYTGHYLCTVAAGGHQKVVKPLRFGKRRNAVIIVNRQLCIANAFEEKIQEMFPRFHKGIRKAYDDYGYPLSQVITTPLRADLVYLLMKPLEWGFLVFLYLTDVRPEQRIARQYKL